MKARFFFLAALLFGLAACQTEPEGLDVNVGGEQLVTVNVTVPEAETRANAGSDSSVGAFANGVLGTENDNTTMRYILQVYLKTTNENGEEVYVQSDERLVEYSDGKTVNFEVRLVPKRNYQFVVWADVVADGKNDTDNHYNTSDLKNITLKGEWNAMDESRDAFTATELIENYSGSSDINITLKRPFAKLRVVTTDMKALNNLGIEPTTATVEYKVQHYNAFNALYGKAISDSKNRDIKHENYTIASYGEDVDNGADMTLFSDYFFAENDAVQFELKVYDQNNELINENTFNTDIYVKRNYLTTIKGNILTENNSFDVTIDDAFENGTNWNPEDDKYDVEIWDGKTLSAPKYNATEGVYEISTGSQLAYFAAAINGTLPSTLTRAEAVDYKAETMVLTGDVDLGNNAWTPIGLNADSSAKFSGVFEGNGFKITNLKVDTEDGYTAAGLFGATDGTLKNFTVENASISHVITSSTGGSSNGIAVVAGSLYRKGTIEGVNVKDAVINGNRYIGGIAGYVYGNVKNCSVEKIEIVAVPNVYKNGYDNGDKVGGVAGYYCNESVYTFSGNTVKNFNIRGYRDIGGVVGSDQYGAAKNCRAENGTLTIDQNTNYYEDKTPNAGFVVGRIVNGSTLDASNTSANIEIFYIGGSSIVNHALETNTETINIEMTADAIVAIGAHEPKYYFGGADTKAINIVGNDKVLTFNHNNTDWNYIRCNNEEAKWNIKNVKLTNSGNNNGPWNRHDIRFYNDVTLENVTSDKAIALLANGNLTNVVISDVHPSNSEAYALWITAEGQTVNLTNCQLLAHESKSGDRGIKIDNEYVDAEAKVTLNVDGLKVKSQKKAAIVVKSKAGADINLQNVDLSEVAADNKNAVWVDSSTKQYAGLVSVTGASMVVEGVDPIEGDTADALQNAFATAVATENAVVQLPAGKFTMPTEIANGVTILGAEGAQINAPEGKAVSVTADNVTISNVDFVGNFNGQQKVAVLSLSGKNPTIANCTFTGAAGNGYGITVNGQGADDVITIKNCDFSQDDFFKPIFDNWAGLNGATLVIDGCTLTNGLYTMHIDAGGESGKVIVKNSTLDGFTTNGASLDELVFENCVFGDVAGYACANLYTAHSFINCTFPTKADANNVSNYGLYVTPNAKGDTLVFDGCKMSDGTQLDFSNIAVANGGFLHWDSDTENCKVVVNGTVIAANQEALNAALDAGDTDILLLAGNYELSGLKFVANNVTLKGVDKANVVLNLENSIYLQDKSVTLENLTYNLNAGKGYEEHTFAYVHHATAFNLKNCNVNRLRLNVNEANIEDCTFTLDTSSGFDGYCIYYYGNNNSTVNVKNSTFATAGKGICIYSESAKAYNLNVDKCSFTSSDSATDKAAIQMHTELGIFGNVKITESSATGFADINGGLWNELNNNTKVATDKFDIWVDGTQVH